jgi:ABC-2 type transport system permease protein
MRVIDLAFKDLLQTVRDWKSALFLIVMPILFTLFFGLVFGPAFNPGANEDPRLLVGLVNRDPGGDLSASFQSLLESSDVVRLVLLEEDEVDRAEELVRDQELAAVVTVPAGFSQHTLSGKETGLTIIVDQSTSIGQMAKEGIQTVVSRLLGAVETARISAKAFEAEKGFEGEAARQAYLNEAVALASEVCRRPPFAVIVEKAGPAASDDRAGSQNGFTQSSPGMMVQFAIFGLITSAMVLVLERKTCALQRLLTTPIRRTEVIAGHVLAMFLIVFVQQALLVVVGQLVFDVDYMRQPLAVLLMMGMLALWAASLGLFIGAISNGEEQVIVWSLIAMFVFAAMGGAWFPLEVAGKTFAAIGHLMPTAWAMDGFQNIIVRGQGLNSVLIPAGLLLVYAVVFFGLAVWRFRFE